MNKEELKELAATLNGIADGKDWEFKGISENWHTGNLAVNNPPRLAADGWEIRLKPWQLPQPPDGMQWHRDEWTEEMLPDGYRPLLTGEKLHDGVETFWTSQSHCGWSRETDFAITNPEKYQWHFFRTKRPLPQPQQPDPHAELKAAHAAGKVIQYLNHGGYFSDFPDDKEPEFLMPPNKYRIKPEQQKVPLGPGDVPPGTVLRGAGEAADPGHQGWCMITSSSLTGIRIWRHSDCDQVEIKWQTLMDAQSEIWRPTDTEWQPCYKLIDTP